ncbi:TetR/AcrR family transcriptional regulator [Amorphoplanes digitatis]|uniref:AcrR family transcriptional regulator n=1 Tax=Actinoplanes digitatis TaxID=1868 RepID=A0A7W7MQ76_9ACTN|nr:TetR/AcrR family transcriptional regulator [Actinoplanes digitatis]MBB4762863.1 AcrR family transcriptional regulator [Actinoplanes digitatis]BFE71802.1 TetR/AcrR family transcriptional regulator [Actinoplanes digitatis]GID91642.1 TetR family transcriptional regulator [Actinoplanes digitatis]
MSTSQAGRSYHHGDLRTALLDAALGLLDDGETFSLRAVARRAGVSPNAPYRHYEDKEALLSALAGCGFDRLADRLEAAPDLAAMAGVYVAFALERPGLFRLMYGRPTANAAWARTAEILASRVATPALRVGAWALVHGLAVLLLDGKLECADPDALVRTTVAAVLTPAVGA